MSSPDQDLPVSGRFRGLAGAGALTLCLASCSGGSLSGTSTPERVRPMMATATAALEQWPDLRRSIGAEDRTDVVHCETQYLGEDGAGEPGGRMYVWAMCEEVVAGSQGGAVSAPYRLTASDRGDGAWVEVQTLPDGASDEQVARLFPERLRGAARGQGIDVDELERRLVSRRRGVSTP